MLKNIIVLMAMRLLFIGCSNDEEPSEIKYPTREITWVKDGSRMILLPASNFEMGNSNNEPDILMEHSRPIHTIKLDAFYIDVHEVQVRQFKKLFNDADIHHPQLLIMKNHWKNTGQKFLRYHQRITIQ